jgi:RNA polymerase sigma-70 factor (ECF subfamily)
MNASEDKRRLYETAVEAYADSMYRVAFRMVGDADLANEIVQDTFLAAWKNLEQLQDVAALKGWMFSILRNQFSRLARREFRQPRSADVEWYAVEHHEDGARGDIRESVQQAIHQLDDDHKLPLLLVAMEGWSTEEASEMLGIPRGTVLSRLHRGRERLRQLLWEHDPAHGRVDEQ